MARGPMKRDTEDQSHHINQSYGGYQNLGTKGNLTNERDSEKAQETRIADLDSTLTSPQWL